MPSRRRGIYRNLNLLCLLSDSQDSEFEEVVSPRAASGNMTVGQSGHSRWALSKSQATPGPSVGVMWGRKEVADPSCPTELPQPPSCLPSEDRPFVVFLRRVVEGKEVVGIFLLFVFFNTQPCPPRHTPTLSRVSVSVSVLILAPRRLPRGIPSLLYFSPTLGATSGRLLGFSLLTDSFWRVPSPAPGASMAHGSPLLRQARRRAPQFQFKLTSLG